MNNTKALDLHGLTHNQYVYLEALLVNIATARWTGDTSFRFMPNVGSPAPYMGFITKPLNEVNLLTLDDVLTMLEGYGDYHTITYVGEPATVANTETPKRYSGESGVELSYDTSDSKKHPFRFKVAAFFVWLFGLSMLIFPVAGILAIFQVPFAGYVALASLAIFALSIILVHCLVTEDEFDALEYNGTLRGTM